MVLVLCTSSDNALYLYQDVCKYLKGSYCAETTPTVKFRKWEFSVTDVGGVTVLVFCMFFDDALYLYQGSCKYLKGF